MARRGSVPGRSCRRLRGRCPAAARRQGRRRGLPWRAMACVRRAAGRAPPRPSAIESSETCHRPSGTGRDVDWTLEIEVAGPMRPLVASTPAAAATGSAPIDGVSLRRDARRHLALPGRCWRLAPRARPPPPCPTRRRAVFPRDLPEPAGSTRSNGGVRDGPARAGRRRRTGDGPTIRPVLERATIDRDLEDLRARLEARIGRWRPPSRRAAGADSSSRPWFGPSIRSRIATSRWMSRPRCGAATWALARANSMRLRDRSRAGRTTGSRTRRSRVSRLGSRDAGGRSTMVA